MTVCPRDGATLVQEVARSGDEQWHVDRCPKCTDILNPVRIDPPPTPVKVVT